mmetsp:Transcript_337/g.717  ORF Transcript_337/g.717 Transcript_337/m.717 type:complete len:694 (-) Transcript_337:28-2109(-)
MQFKRKTRLGSPSFSTSTIPQYMMMASLFAIASLLVFRSSPGDVTNDMTNNDVSKLRSKAADGEAESPSLVEDSSEQNIEKNIHEEESKQITRQISPERKASLLNSPEAVESLPSCVAVRETFATSSTFDGSRPTIFSGWDSPALEKWANKGNFQSYFGEHEQYIKGRDVQPLKDAAGKHCKTSTETLIDSMSKLFSAKNDAANRGEKMKNKDTTKEIDLLFFTNDKENPHFFESLSKDYSPPAPIEKLDVFNNKGFRVFSAMEQGSSHPFHFHDAAWLGQVSGSRLWYFLPPDTPKVKPKVNGCEYLYGRVPLPSGTTACVQEAGEVMYFPSKWLHSTCALEPWSVGIGGQGGSPNVYDQGFEQLLSKHDASEAAQKDKMEECGVFKSEKQTPVKEDNITEKDWKWFDGNLNEYYNKLERDEHEKRDPNVITSYAVHRWMGPEKKTLTHYQLVREAIYEHVIRRFPPSAETVAGDGVALRVFDAGCGLGAGLMWFEQHEPSWELVGHTISEDQYNWIVNDLPEHRFTAYLRTYDEPLGDGGIVTFNAIYSIEAAIHSPNLKISLTAWSKALSPGGVIVIVDDFLSVGTSRDDPDVDLFTRAWLANAVHTTTEISHWADELDMTLVRDRDLGSEFQIVKRNYRNKVPELKDEKGRVHQAWLGSKARQRLTVHGKISYRLIVLRKNSESNIDLQ